MNDEGTKAVRNFGVLFIATLFLYVTIYGGCAAARQRGGPWVVIQGKGAGGEPWVRIAHHRVLGTVTFLPFGDTTALSWDLTLTQP